MHRRRTVHTGPETLGEVKHLGRSDSESDSEADSCPILVTESIKNRPQNRQGLTGPILRTILRRF